MAPDLSSLVSALSDRWHRTRVSKGFTVVMARLRRKSPGAIAQPIRRVRATSAASAPGTGAGNPSNVMIGRWRAFRGSRAFVPAAILAPVLALSSGGGVYAAWDSTRVVMPDVIGQPLADGIEQLALSDIHVDDTELPDPTLDANCYVISRQSADAGDRVVPAEAIGLDFEPARRTVPDLTGMTLSEARRSLSANCLHEKQAHVWCVPDGFSGDAETLTATELEQDTGFTFDPIFTRLRHQTLTPDDSWIVCDQLTNPSKRVDAGSEVGLVLTAPLTTVPAPTSPSLGSVLEALDETADGCTLASTIVTAFPENPDALRGVRPPPAEQMADWAVSSLTPAPGRALLCEQTIRIELIWPKTVMPNLVGLFHAPGSPQTATATTSTLESAGLVAACSGNGTVTSQSPAAGEAVPIGTPVTCVAELVMPNVVGMTPVAAQATLVAAGVTATSSGSGVVVSQSPAAGTKLISSSGGATFYAEQPRPAPFVGGGSAYYENCTAARAAGAAPIYRGEPGYAPKLDRDNDGIACE